MTPSTLIFGLHYYFLNQSSLGCLVYDTFLSILHCLCHCTFCIPIISTLNFNISFSTSIIFPFCCKVLKFQVASFNCWALDQVRSAISLSISCSSSNSKIRFSKASRFPNWRTNSLRSNGRVKLYNFSSLHQCHSHRRRGPTLHCVEVS